MPITLRLILGDQLNLSHPWFRKPTPDVVYAMMECRSETDYVRHHIQKVAGFFAAMRYFADQLRTKGFAVEYLKLDDPANRQSVGENLRAMALRLGAGQIEYQLPDEYRLDTELSRLQLEMAIPVVAVDSAHFLTGRSDLAVFFRGRKTFVMESFYRSMRIKTGLLMESDGRTPIGGRWNFDAENRRRLPEGVVLPPALDFAHNVRDIFEMLSRTGVPTIGSIDPDNFSWPVSREDALMLLEHFIAHRLPLFGVYQDALSERDEVLFHSRLSFALNTKMLSPLEVSRAAEAYYIESPDLQRLAQVEGFIRQIIGWREYMRGVYWAKMPEYASLNYFGHSAPLPSWFWTGNTRMRCLQKAIQQSLDSAYAHHIQRLMVTGNFALLLGVSPDELDAWYLGIYIDALEWVEITNTRGMSQYADGGIVGTKPYVSSANYIRKMGDHCSKCPYDPERRYGEGACPFNSLYWDFYARHAEKLSRNPRIGMAYSTWAKMAGTEREQILEQAAAYKAGADNL